MTHRYAAEPKNVNEFQAGLKNWDKTVDRFKDCGTTYRLAVKYRDDYIKRYFAYLMRGTYDR